MITLNCILSTKKEKPVWIYGFDDYAKGILALLTKCRMHVEGFVIGNEQRYMCGLEYLGKPIVLPELICKQSGKVLLIDAFGVLSDSRELKNVIRTPLLDKYLCKEDAKWLLCKKITAPDTKGNEVQYSSAGLRYQICNLDRAGVSTLLFGCRNDVKLVKERLAILGIRFKGAISADGFVGADEGLAFFSVETVKWLAANMSVRIRVLSGYEKDAVQYATENNIPRCLFGLDVDVRHCIDLVATLDPNLGYSYGWDNHTECIFETVGEGSFVVGIVGDSTTAVGITCEKSWPEHLVDIMNQRKIGAKVYCMAVEGYIASQQLIKVIRDVLPFNFDVLISVSRVSGYYNSSYKNPFVHRYQEHLTSKLSNEYDNKPVYWGSGEITPADDWFRCQKAMHGICEEFGIEFHSFIAPVLFEKERLSRNERELLLHDDHNVDDKLMYIEYLRSVKACIWNVGTKSWLHDLSNEYNEIDDVFMDTGHLLSRGNRFMAEFILDAISVLQVNK